MEKSYRAIVYFFIAVFIFVFFGFFRSYFGLFPSFVGITPSLHLHAFLMLTWVGLLVAQPILITKKKMRTHRYLGYLSYGLVPVIICVLLLMYRNQYYRLEHEISHEENLAILFLPSTDIVPFMIFYILAIVNQKNTAKHMRYMICTAIVILSAGLFRIIMILFKPEFFIGFEITTVLLILFFIGFLIYDTINKKPILSNPFLTASIIFGIPNVLFLILPKTMWWQSTAQTVVNFLL